MRISHDCPFLGVLRKKMKNRRCPSDRVGVLTGLDIAVHHVIRQVRHYQKFNQNLLQLYRQILESLRRVDSEGKYSYCFGYKKLRTQQSLSGRQKAYTIRCADTVTSTGSLARDAASRVPRSLPHAGMCVMPFWRP